MEGGMKTIQFENRSLAIKDSNYGKLTQKLNQVLEQISLGIVDTKILNEPKFDNQNDYNEAIKRAKFNLLLQIQNITKKMCFFHKTHT